MADLRTWRIIRRNRVFSALPHLAVDVEAVELPDGRVIDDYYRVEMRDYVLVFATDDYGRAAVLRSYKHGPGRVCLSFPGGYLAEGETPLDAARRELLEEGGLASENFTYLGGFVTNANQGCNTAHFFTAAGCAPVADPDSGDIEEMELAFMEMDALFAALRAGEFATLSQAALLGLATHGTRPGVCPRDARTRSCGETGGEPGAGPGGCLWLTCKEGK